MPLQDSRRICLFHSRYIRASFVAETKHARGLWQRYREDAPRMTRRTFCATLPRFGFEWEGQISLRRLARGTTLEYLNNRNPCLLGLLWRWLRRRHLLRSQREPCDLQHRWQRKPRRHLPTLTCLTTSSGPKTWRFWLYAFRSTEACLLNAQRSLSTPPREGRRRGIR